MFRATRHKIPDEPPPRSKNLAARAGRWSASHRKTAILGWFALVIVAFVAGGQVGQKTTTDSDFRHGESGRADKAIAEHFPEPAAEEQVIVSSDRLHAGDPRFDRTVKSVVATLRTSRNVVNVRSPLNGEAPIAADRRSALIQFAIAGDRDEAAGRVGPVTQRIETLSRANPDFWIGLTGDASLQHDIENAFGTDLSKAGKLSIPVTLLILLLAFGALVAAGIPVVLAITAVIATVGLVNLLSQVSAVDQAIAEVVLLVGMAVGVDYSLFYIRREREERAAGRSPQAALEAAAATSGRAVLMSGVIVIAAMAGMLIAGDRTFISFGVGAMLVVAVALVGSLTVLPAMLSALGDRVERGRLPLIRSARDTTVGEHGAWRVIVTRVLRRPVVSAVLATAILIAVALPGFGLKTQQTGPSDFPQDLPSIQAFHQMKDAFPQKNLAAVVAYRASNVRSPAARAAIADFSDLALANRVSAAAPEVHYSEDGHLAEIMVPIAGSTDQSTAEKAVRELRHSVIPASLARLPGSRAEVTGMAAQSVDFNQLLSQRVPLVFLFVLGLSFVLLLLTFRSIVIPIKAIILNLLSVGAAYGVLVLVFQHGWGADLLGFEPTGSIAPWLPLFLFVILFGLSMDYHIFILSRIREFVGRGQSTDDAVVAGISQTAGVVTTAAAVMVAVFAVFATLEILPFKQMGVGLAAAVLIDATIIRAVLLPASMKLLGNWNWYLPSWLEWLPHLGGHSKGERQSTVASAAFAAEAPTGAPIQT